MRLLSTFSLLLTLACVAPSLAASRGATELKECPAEFPVEAVKLAPLPPGWVGIASDKILHTSTDVIFGPPNHLGVIVGKRKKTRDGYTVTFDELHLPAAPALDKWLVCRYGNDLALAQQLPDNTKRCVVTYTRDAYNGYAIRYSCHGKP